MSERSEWKFQVHVEEVEALAQKRVLHHESRVAHYETERERLEREYIASVEASAKKATEAEQVAAQQYLEHVHNNLSSSPVLGGPKQVIGDPEVHQRLQDAHQRISSHTSKVKTYQMWVNLLGFAPRDGVMEIDIEDAHFFGVES